MVVRVELERRGVLLLEGLRDELPVGPSFSVVAGSSTASALSVRQTPPFVAAIQSVHSSGAGLQSGEITAACVRPLKFSVPAV